jgi:hypothetical protein
MKILYKFLCLLLIAFFFLAAVGNVNAGRPKYIFKVASLAPEGSVWTKRFRDFTAEVTEKSGGDIGFKIYAGGVMGDDRAIWGYPFSLTPMKKLTIYGRSSSQGCKKNLIKKIWYFWQCPRWASYTPCHKNRSPRWIN